MEAFKQKGRANTIPHTVLSFPTRKVSNWNLTRGLFLVSPSSIFFKHTHGSDFIIIKMMLYRFVRELSSVHIGLHYFTHFAIHLVTFILCDIFILLLKMRCGLNRCFAGLGSTFL